MTLFRDEPTEAHFEALYAFTQGPLLAWISSSLFRRGSAADPTEVLQDTYVNLYRYARTFRDERAQSFRVWSRTIAANLVRRSRRETARPSLQALPEGLQEPADRTAFGPSVQAMMGEERVATVRAYQLLLRHYHAAFAALSPRDREALELVEVEGKSYAEACEILQVGMSNMKMIMFRARRRLRDRLLKSLGLEDEPEAVRLAG